jgi:hypothetical protein
MRGDRAHAEDQHLKKFAIGTFPPGIAVRADYLDILRINQLDWNMIILCGEPLVPRLSSKAGQQLGYGGDRIGLVARFKKSQEVRSNRCVPTGP